MIEITGIAPPTSREALTRSPGSQEVLANTYPTLEVRRLSVDGLEGEWHFVKGRRIEPPGAKSRVQVQSLRYGVFFDPVKRIWLKVVHPDSLGTTQYQVYEERLRRSAEHQRISLEVAGLPDLARQIKDSEVEIDGRVVYGFTSPHIGPSLEHFISVATQKRRSSELPPECAELLSSIYSIAGGTAERLLLREGVFTGDPNPGNILLHFDENGFHTVLIDFANKVQTEDHLLPGIPRDRYPGTRYISKLHTTLFGKVRNLHQGFIAFAGELGLTFNRDQSEVSRNINQSVAVETARKSLSSETSQPAGPNTNSG